MARRLLRRQSQSLKATPTFVFAVEVPDFLPVVVSDEVEQRPRVEGPQVEFVARLLTRAVGRHARRHEGHPERRAVRLDRVQRARRVRAKQRKDSSRRHQLANCTTGTKYICNLITYGYNRSQDYFHIIYRIRRKAIDPDQVNKLQTVPCSEAILPYELDS